jgi:HD superfamily phosphohydrolase
MSYLDTFKKFRLTESAEAENIFKEDELDEMSTSAGAGAYDTPNAFGELGDDTIEMLGYKKVKKVKKEAVEESDFKKLSKEMFINEIAYNEYKKDPIASPKQKINTSINYINKGLKEIEKVVNHNVRLKQEMGVDNGIYWKSSRENLTKISERLLRVSKQLKELAS